MQHRRFEALQQRGKNDLCDMMDDIEEHWRVEGGLRMKDEKAVSI
jgi:hypothetical protein